MSSKPIEPRAIASQLVLLFASTAVVLLFCGLGVLYWIVVRHSYEEDNVVLADKLDALRAEFEKPGGAEAFNAVITATRPLENATFHVRLIDSKGATLAETAGMRALAPDAFPGVAGNKPVTPVAQRSAGRLFALSATQARVGDQVFTIQVAQDRASDERFAQEFGILALCVLGAGSVAAALVARSVTSRGLKPLTQLAETVQQVSAARLDQRIGTRIWPRELKPVAAAFDQMLGRLEESFTRLSQFSADLAHELRTPVANIRGEAEVALGRSRSAEEYRAVLESSVVEAERLSGMIDNLLFLARAEAADRQIALNEFDGRSALEKIAAYHRTLAEERQVQIECRGEGTVRADSMLFGRAVSNLVDNALRFVRPGGRIDIVMQSDQSGATVTVSDDGAGISPADLPHVFDRLYRGDKSRSSSGTGLGLAIVKSIMALHHGTVSLESEENHGTAVTLRFPRSIQ